MDTNEQEFLKRLRETFRIEAEERLQALSAGFLELEKSTDPIRAAKIIETVFRESHSLKGAARSVSLKDIESICQSLESALAALKRQEISLSAPLFDLFHQAVDTLVRLMVGMEAQQTSAERNTLRELGRRLVEASQGNIFQTPDEKSAPVESRTTPEIDQPTSLHQTETPSASLPENKEITFKPKTTEESNEKAPAQNTATLPAKGETFPISVETVRIPISKLDPLLLQAEEMIQAKLAGGQRAAELHEIQESLISWKAEWGRWNAQRSVGTNEVPEWVTLQLDQLTEKITTINQVFAQDQRNLRHMIDDHLDAMKQVLMLQVSTLTAIFPRLVRDLAREQGKEIDLDLRGTDIEIDKRILEELKDPLIHLVRNCVDHGIESPGERTRQGKVGRSTITISFNAKDSRQFEILVTDDGNGINLDRVQAAAIRSGLISAEAAGKTKKNEMLQLIFESGLSTSEIITDLSGRGLGLAIVREKVQKLGGMVTVDSQAGVGTSFHLLLPLTLATFRGVLVRASEKIFVLPTSNVERVLRLDLKEVQTVENQDTIQVEGNILSLVKLEEVLGLSSIKNGNSRRRSLGSQANQADHVPVLVLVSAEKRIALQVDEVLAEKEVLVKGLGKQLRRVRNIAGATILGAGSVVPVLNIADLMNSAVRPGISASASRTDEKDSAVTGRILVAEDSITSRTLLKNILESGGYLVTTAIDGADAFSQLKCSDFDLVVSDVDMPRLSGFELTTRIRASKKLSELPVILVTALESRQDRERGIEVGANAYIVKSSFDQSNLLEVINRLL